MFGKKKEEMIVCDKCGTLTSKSKLKKCHTCGMVLCKKCRKDHVCSIIHTNIETGSVIFQNSESRQENPQCVIKITDMRIYEIARSPSIMTEEERIIIETDSDVRRRYLHYQSVISEKGY